MSLNKKRNIYIGADCQDFSVFKETDPKANPRFYSKIFTKNEMAYCTSKALPFQHFAARFAAKEAVIKALTPQRISHNQIEILNDERGRPHIKFHNGVLDKKYEFKVSISHTKSIAIAFVLGFKVECNCQ